MNAATGIARFAGDLPPVGAFAGLGEGGTPVVPLPNLAADLGLRRLSAKLESHNPTGSYKDRVAAMSLSLAVDRGARGWIATSSGNAGMAFAAYGARAGLPGCLCVVATLPPEKKLPLLAFGTRVIAVGGVGDGTAGTAVTELMRQVRDAAERHGLFLGITAIAFNPDGMRGIDTIGYELAAQRPRLTQLYVPTGGGGLLASVARGLAHRSLHPAIVACQPSGCAPIARFLAGDLAEPVVDRCETRISALQLPEPPDAALAIEAVRATDGWGGTAGDEEILRAQRLLATREGIFVEPAAAAALAVLAQDVKAGRLGRDDDDPVLLLTGAGWKDLGRFTADAAAVPATDLRDLRGHLDAWTEAL